MSGPFGRYVAQTHPDPTASGYYTMLDTDTAETSGRYWGEEQAVQRANHLNQTHPYGATAPTTQHTLEDE